MLATVTDIRLEGNLPEAVTDAKLLPHLEKASSELKRKLGAELYDEIKAEGSGDRFEDCRKAEANMALAYAIIPLNTETSGSGIIRNTGFDESRQELLSINESKQMAEHYKAVANELLKPYLPKPLTDEDGESDYFRSGSIRIGAI